MTLVVAVTGDKSIWMLADRRISFPAPGLPRDDAIKFISLETTDGAAILGYSGLGSTKFGTEPSDWMARVLRGRNLSLEQSLREIANAVRARLPKHLETLIDPNSRVHTIIIPAFLNGQSRLYSINLKHSREINGRSFNFTRHITNRGLPKEYPTRQVAVAGSGAVHLLGNKRWARDLLKMVAAHDAGRISSQAVASAFAILNNKVSRAEITVGKKCIVAWKLIEGGGGHEFFNGIHKDNNNGLTWIPSITNGGDITALIKATLPLTLAFLNGPNNEIDREAMDAALAQLPGTPDDSLS